MGLQLSFKDMCPKLEKQNLRSHSGLHRLQFRAVQNMGRFPSIQKRKSPKAANV
jgi:hypothetical protein